MLLNCFCCEQAAAIRPATFRKLYYAFHNIHWFSANALHCMQEHEKATSQHQQERQRLASSLSECQGMIQTAHQQHQVSHQLFHTLPASRKWVFYTCASAAIAISKSVWKLAALSSDLYARLWCCTQGTFQHRIIVTSPFSSWDVTV